MHNAEAGWPAQQGKSLDSQTLAALGTACIDDSAATACFHAN